MLKQDIQAYTAFIGNKLLIHGDLETVVLKVRGQLKNEPTASILVFSDTTGKQMDFDLSGTEKEVLQRLKVYLMPEIKEASTGPGRPKLGVISREISLLPRHWEWLSNQSGGASVTIRRLIDEARKQSSGKEKINQAQERTYKFLSAIAGNFPHYEEALRALFAQNKKEFDLLIASWPNSIKKYASKLAEESFHK